MLREQTPQVQVKVVDTLQVAMSHGWAAIESARSALTGLSLDEVVQRAHEVAQKSTMIQTADTLRYLYLGGRIGKAKHLVASVLNIKPLIGMQDGIIVAMGTARSRLKAYRRMVDLMEQQAGEGAKIKVAFTHVAALEETKKLQSFVTARFECVETIVTELSPALAVHTGLHLWRLAKL